MSTIVSRRTVGSVLPLLALAAAPLHGQSETRTLSGSSVAIYNLAGRMTVERGSGSEVTVEVTFRGRDASRLRLESGDVRGRNALRVIYPDDEIIYAEQGRGNNSSTFELYDDYTWGSDNGRGENRRRVRVRSRGDGLEAWADVRITVPAGRTVAAYLAVGELTATDVDGDVRLDVAAARVTATGSRGRLVVDAGSGAIEVRDANVSDLELDTGSGSVTLTQVTSRRCVVDTGSGDVTANSVSCDDLDIDVGSGTVRVDQARAPNVRVDAGSGSVAVHFTSTIRQLDIETGSGGVTVSLPEGTGANLDISTGSGSISSDFPVQMQRMQRRELQGRIGNGDGAIRIETGSGSVRLRRS